MRKLLSLTTLLLVLMGIGIAQVTDKEADLKKISSDTTDGWEKGGMLSITFGQTGFSTYWAAGGINSVTINGIAGLFANYKKGKLSWDNTLDLGFGKQRQGKDDNVKLLKTDDKIDFASKLGVKANDQLYYAVLTNFKTQFTDGFNYPDDTTVISSFLAPGYLLFAAGIDYKPNKYITAFVAPVTSKSTFVNNTLLSDAGAFGVEPGKKFRSEFGGYVRAAFAKDIMKNVNLTTKLDLFSNYLNNPQNIDVNWEVLIGMKVNKFISANISTQLIYDDDIKFQIVDDNGLPIVGKLGPRAQFKELIAVGFSYKF
jgi:hypothetical protein